MSRQTSAPFVLACPECDVRKETDDPAEIVAFYRRHHGLTGHELTWVRADVNSVGGAPSAADTKSVVVELDERFENGVPLGIVAAVMKQRRSVGETLSDVYDLRMRGELYEPQDDHVSAL